MTECPILLKTSRSTSNFPFGSRTSFFWFFNSFFCLGSGRGTNLWSQPLGFFAPYYYWSPGFTLYHLYFVALPVWSVGRQDRRGCLDCLSTVEYALVCVSGRRGISSWPSTWWGPQPKKKSEGVKLCSDQRYWPPWSLVSSLSSFRALMASRCWDIFSRKSEPWMFKSLIRWGGEIYLSLGDRFLIINLK